MSQNNPPLRTFSAQIDEGLMRRFKSTVTAKGLKYRAVLTQLLTQFCECSQDSVAQQKSQRSQLWERNQKGEK